MWIKTIHPRLWGTQPRFAPQLMPASVFRAFSNCGQILDNLYTPKDSYRHFLENFYILVYQYITPHIWGYRF